ncbi:MAG: FAD-dependent oxidoreductase [Planctomycetota bacterium]
MAVVRPKEASQIARLLPRLAQHKTPWHAISRGKNWGYGDACAATDGYVIVDLKNMNKILEINEELAYAVIQPGVSQGQLVDELQKRGSRLMLDVTGAGPEASIVGNTLQRGFGHTPYGDHFAHSCNYEYILPDGKLCRTGFGEVTASDVGHVYPYGQGPSTQGALAQSNAAVVTRMTVALMPRPESIQGFGFKTPDPQSLFQILDKLRELRLSGLVDSVVHVANDLRVLSTQPWFEESCTGQDPLDASQRRVLRGRAGVGCWNGLGGLYGSKSILTAKKRLLRREFKQICRLQFFSERHVNLLQSVSRLFPNHPRLQKIQNLSRTVSDVYALLRGIPSPNHLDGAFFRRRPDSGEVSDTGLIWIAPVIPCRGEDALRLLNVIEPLANEHGFDLPITISPVMDRSAVCIANLAFNKQSAEESARAAAAYSAIQAAMNGLGYPAYRASSVPMTSR